MEIMLKPDIKKRWLVALRSKLYRQGRFALKSKSKRQRYFRYCCLGVLCELHAEETIRLWQTVAYPDAEGAQKYISSDIELGYTTLKWASLGKDQQQELAQMNDSGDSFAKIANYIEENL